MLTQTKETSVSSEITQNILEKIQTLAPEKQQQVLDFIEFLVYKQQETQTSPSEQPPKKRIPGLHKGKIWMSDDFNEPLDVDFWGF